MSSLDYTNVVYLSALKLRGVMYLGDFVTVTATVLSSYFVNIFVKQIRLMFPHDPSTPIRISSPESRPNFLPSSFFRVSPNFLPRASSASKLLPLGHLPPRRPPAHLQMRRSFFSGFLTKMELKRWKTHRPSHSLCKQRE